jgi:signal transduction histidine kinase
MNAFSSLAGEQTPQVMLYHPAQDIWIYLLAAAVLLTLAAYSWRYRKNPAALYLSLGLVDKSIWLLSIVMITVSPNLADKILWLKILNLDAIAVAPITLMVALHITGKKAATSKTVRGLLLPLIALSWLLVLTNELHGWFWRDLLWDGATLGTVRGPANWGIMTAGYIGIIISLALFAHRAVKTSGLRRWQAIAVPANMAISIAGHARWVSTQSDIIPPLPLTFLLGGLVWFGIFFGLRVFNLQELAEATVTRDMNDCLIVTDAQDHVVELNPAAEGLFGERAGALAGERAGAAFAPWPALAALAESREARTGEIAVAGGHYIYRVSLLTGWGGKNIGKAIVLQDIGTLKRAQEKIIEQEKALSVMAEQGRLGRELHDGAGQVWNYFSLKLQTVEALLAGERPEAAKQEIASLLGTVRQMNADARESIVGLKLAGDTGDDFIAKLKDYLAWYRESTGIDVELTLPPDRTEKIISRFREVQLLRIIQEALTNIRKHAGAGRVRVCIEKRGNQAVVLVEDDGCGFDMTAFTPGKASFGLQIMAERAAEAGGRLEIESKMGAGTKVTVRFDPESAEGKVKSNENTAGR